MLLTLAHLSATSSPRFQIPDLLLQVTGNPQAYLRNSGTIFLLTLGPLAHVTVFKSELETSFY